MSASNTPEPQLEPESLYDRRSLIRISEFSDITGGCVHIRERKNLSDAKAEFVVEFNTWVDGVARLVNAGFNTDGRKWFSFWVYNESTAWREAFKHWLTTSLESAGYHAVLEDHVKEIKVCVSVDIIPVHARPKV